MTTEQDQHQDERDEIVEAFRDAEPVLHERICTSRLFRSHSGVLDFALDRQLTKAAKLRFDGDWDEARAAAAEAYTTMYLIAGLPDEQAREKGTELADDGAGGALAALKDML